MVEEVAAQSEHEVLPDAGEAADERGLQHPRGRVDPEIDEDVALEPAAVAVAHALVDRVLDDEERADGRGGREDADDRQRGDAQAPAVQVAAEPREPGVRCTRLTRQ